MLVDALLVHLIPSLLQASLFAVSKSLTLIFVSLFIPSLVCSFD